MISKYMVIVGILACGAHSYGMDTSSMPTPPQSPKTPRHLGRSSDAIKRQASRELAKRAGGTPYLDSPCGNFIGKGSSPLAPLDPSAVYYGSYCP